MENSSQTFDTSITILEEKQRLKNSIDIVGRALVFNFILSIILCLVFEKLSYMLFLDSNYINTKFGGISPIAYYLQFGIVSTIYNFVPALFIKSRTHKTFGEILPLEKKRGSNSKLLIMVGLAVLVIAQLIASLIAVTAEAIHFPVPDLSFPYVNDPLVITLSWIGYALFPAILEEFLYRGMIMNSLRQHGDVFTVVVSAILFGLAHGNICQTPFAFVLGIFFGFIVVKTNSLIPSIILHLINNSLAVIFEVITNMYGESIGTLASTAVFSIMLLLGIIAFIILIKNKHDSLSLQPSTTLLTAKEKTWCFLRRPIIIIFILLYLFIIIRY